MNFKLLHAMALSTLFFVGTSAFAQRDPPVWDSFLSPITISTDSRNSLTTTFTFHKNGGPHEHREHQCYILAYAKADEAEILKFVADRDVVNKKRQAENSFLATLLDQKLVVTLETIASTRLSKEQADKEGLGTGNCFPFKFDFDCPTLFEKLGDLEHFDKTNVDEWDGAEKITWFNDTFGLIVFVPVNDSIFSTKVAEDLRTKGDFSNSVDLETSILHFRSLPYVLKFKKYGEKLMLYIN